MAEEELNQQELQEEKHIIPYGKYYNMVQFLNNLDDIELKLLLRLLQNEFCQRNTDKEHCYNCGLPSCLCRQIYDFTENLPDEVEIK